MTLLRYVVRTVLAIIVLALLWSFRYRYDHTLIDGNTYIVRIHRVTGHADILLPEDGWVPAEDSWDDSPAPETHS